MLLEFRAKNYRSFSDELVFSLTPVPELHELDYSILSVPAGDTQYQGLSAAVIYGPNAAGKSNMIEAMETLREIVLRGNINNGILSSYSAAANLELIPNCFSGASPTSFCIRFVDSDMLIEYTLSAELGPFLDERYPRKILEEKLCINGDLVFLRNDQVVLNPAAIIAMSTSPANFNAEQIAVIQEIASQSLADTGLFLSYGLKLVSLQDTEKRIMEWFQKKLIVLNPSDDLMAVRKYLGITENSICVEKTLTDAVSEFGVTESILRYETVALEGRQPMLFSLIPRQKSENAGKSVPAEAFESCGTLRFVNLFPLIVYALLNGATLVLDDFGANIHPMALMSIVNAFHNDDINKNCAQLIFNSHNPIFLDSSVFRKDEIKFVDRDEAGRSIQYALSDFEVEEDDHWKENYLNHYFLGKYGALKDVDFSSILEKIVSHAEEH